MFIFVFIRIQRKHFGVHYDAFKGMTPKRGFVRRGHSRILSKVSNGILTVFFTDQRNTWVTIFYQFIVLLKKIIHKNVIEKNVRVVLSFWRCVYYISGIIYQRGIIYLYRF